MDTNRKAWNERHKKLRHALEKTGDQKLATELFLTQHASVHSSKASKIKTYSFSDEILSDLSIDMWRYIPSHGNHSIAWIIWHISRIEDVTTNLLLAGSDQILNRGAWSDKLKIKELHTGNGMIDQEIAELTDNIDIKALMNYRLAVAKNTQKIVPELDSSDYTRKVNPKMILRIWDENAMLSNAKGIVKYWANRTIAGLLLMPPTRHVFLHLNEARRIKTKAIAGLK